MNKEFQFFTYLLECYATYKDEKTHIILELLSEKKLVEFVMSMYELYHCEAIENAFMDLDSLLETGRPAW